MINSYVAKRTAQPGRTLMATSKELPNTLTTMIAAALEPGERIVWTGQPRITPTAIAMLIAMGFGLAFWLAFCFALIGSGVFGLIFLYTAFVSWVGLWSIMALCQRWVIRNTCYVVTDRRAIAFVPHRRRGYRVFVNLPEDLASVRCVTFWNGYGSIVWIEDTGSQIFLYRGGFTAITNAQEVLDLMYDAFLPLIASRLKDPNPDVRRKAVSSLVKIGSSAKQAVPYLIATLESDDSFVRDRAAHALGQLGNKAKPAIQALKRTLLIDDSRKVAEAARKAIGKIDCQSRSLRVPGYRSR